MGDYWMGALAPDKKAAPIYRLVIPGSHNSFTHALDTSCDIANDIPEMVKGMPPIPTIKQIIHNWSKTQSLNTKQQLDAGVRYLDVRISVPDGHEQVVTEVRAVHGLYAQHITVIVDEIKTWLLEHPTEIVLIDFNHFYNFTAPLHTALQKDLTQRLGNLVQPRCALPEMSIDGVLGRKHQALVFYQPRAEDTITVSDAFFQAADIRAPWAQTNLPYNMLTYQMDALMKTPKRQHFHCTQGILTPNMADIMRAANGTLEAKMARPATESVLKWLHENDAVIRPLLNIVTVDFVETADFCAKIVNLNHV